MPQFKTARVTDDSAISSVDDALGLAEAATADILGCPKNADIDAPILGLVDGNGRIVGDGTTPARVPSIYNTSASEGSAAAMEFIDSLADIGWRIVPIGSALELRERDPASENSGQLIQNLALERRLTNLDDCDLVENAPDNLIDYAGKVLGVDSNPPYRIIAVDQSGGGGSSTFIGLDDTPLGWAGIEHGMIPIAIRTGGGPGDADHLEFTSGGGGANVFTSLDDTYVDHAGKAQANIAVANDETGLVAAFQWFSRGENSNPQELAYNVSEGLVNWGDDEYKFPDDANIIQGANLVFDDEPDKDCVYQVNYMLRLTNNSLARNIIGVKVYAQSIDGGATAFHENIVNGKNLDSSSDAAVPRTLNGSFMVRIPYGAHDPGDRAIQMAYGRVVPFGGNDEWAFQAGVSTQQAIRIAYTSIEICRVN